MNMKKTVYTINPARHFAEALAARLLDRTVENPLALTDVTILLPTRRACRTLQETFIRLAKGRSLLLPRMTPIGDIDEHELMFGDSSGAGLNIPPAISSLRRQLILTRLILSKQPDELKIDQAARLAEALSLFLDQTQTQKLSFEALKELAPEQYAKHWKETLEFLKLITEHWPKILKDEGKIDPAERRVLLLTAQADEWKNSPPNREIIVAGSTGSLPASAELLNVVAGLPKGMVVLPGLDCHMDKKSWELIEESHPQYGMKKLLEHFGVDRKDVLEWEETEYNQKQAYPDRVRLISEVMRPADSTDDWRNISKFNAKTLDGVSRLNCTNQREEALSIALLLREALEVSNRTAALVTPDRNLARRVSVELERWDIKLNDSAGVPLSQTPAGIFLRLTAEMVVSEFAPLSVLSALKHPLAACGMNVAEFRPLVRKLETMILRGIRPASGIDGLKTAVESLEKESPFKQKILAWLDVFEKQAKPFVKLMESKKPIQLKKILYEHMLFAETIAANDEKTGAERLWFGSDGNEAAEFAADIDEAADVISDIDGASYPRLFHILMKQRTVRPAFGSHPRLAVLGPMEARLQRPDLLILGGLNEGSWPSDSSIDPWLSRQMRAEFGLPSQDLHTGLSAHDFAQAFCAPNVVLSRSKKVGGTPTVPSRWLLRLDAVMKAVGLEIKELDAVQWLLWAQAVDSADKVTPVKPPAPRPPVADRPKKLSVTQIETLMRDPYAIYAKHILKLKALNPIDADLSMADYGNVVHKVLEEFTGKYPKTFPSDAVEELIKMGEERFLSSSLPPAVAVFWLPRFQRVAEWFVEKENERRNNILQSSNEVEGRLKIGSDFEIFARADRVDILKDGTIGIIDYKTGTVPSAKEIAAGYAPQLPLEALIAKHGGFENIPEHEVSELLFWRLKGDGEGCSEVSAIGKKDTIERLLEETLEGIKALTSAFNNEETPYEAQPFPSKAPKYSDYLHLERVKEWSSTESGDE